MVTTKTSLRFIVSSVGFDTKRRLAASGANQVRKPNSLSQTLDPSFLRRWAGD
jgi:hypothetical protein